MENIYDLAIHGITGYSQLSSRTIQPPEGVEVAEEKKY